MYDPIMVFLIVWGLFSAGLFLLLCFLPREVPLAFVVKLVWWYWILLTFACLESFWFLHQIWMKVLLGRVFLVAGSSLSLLHATPFWLVEFLLGNQLIAWWDFPCMLFVIFPLFLSIFILSLSCQFDYYVSQCVPPWVFPARDSLHFLDLVDYFLSHVREVFNYHLFKYFLRTFL